MRFTYPANISFQCIKCGICCGDTKERNRHILLLSAEAKQISIATLKPISEFAMEIQDKERLPYCFEMHKEKGKCVFLQDNKCAIYSLRPLICRFYPFELRTNEKGKCEFLHTTECPAIGKGKKLGKPDFEQLLQLASDRLNGIKANQDEV